MAETANTAGTAEAADNAGSEGSADIEADRARQAALGRRFPPGRVSDQTAYSMGIFAKYKAGLLEAGATEEMFLDVGRGRTAMSVALAVQHAALSGTNAASRAEVATVTDTKEYLLTLSELVPMVIRVNHLTDLSATDVLPKGTLGRSTGKLTNHLEKTRPLVKKLDDLLKPHFKNKSPLTTHDKLAENLQSLQSAQKSKRGTLPNETFETNVAKGALIERLDNLNRIGRVAYLDQPVIAKQFNMDILFRRTKRRKTAAPEEKRSSDDEEETTDPGVSEPGKPSEPK